MGWKSEAVITDYVVIEGPNDGLFVYNGTPAADNLIQSVATAPGTDPYGNKFLAGFTSYGLVGGVFLALQLLGGAGNSIINWYSNASSHENATYIAYTSISSAGSTSPLFVDVGSGGLGFVVETSQLAVSSTGTSSITSALLEVAGNAAIEAGKAAGVTGAPALVVGAPTAAGDAIVHIADDPSNPRSGSANMLQIEDHSAAPIFAVGAAGGAKVFGDKSGSWNGIGSMAAQLVPWYGVQVGGSSGSTLYSGSGAPLPALITGGLTTYSQTAHVGDYYFRTDTPGVGSQRIYVCTVAGNPGTWVGIL